MPDDDPPEPPQRTNGQNRLSFKLSVPDAITAGITVPVDDANRGIVRWDLTQSDYVATNEAAFTDPNTGLVYTDLIMTSIQAKSTLEATNWQVVGSRIIWLNPDAYRGSFLMCCYDGAGKPVLTNYVQAGDPGWQASTNADAVSSVQLLPSEVGTNHFWRLTCKTNEIGILTE